MNWADAWSRAVRELPAHTPRQFDRWLAEAVTMSMSPQAGKWEREILKKRLDEALLVMERTKPGQVTP